MNELKMDLASERFGESMMIAGAVVLVVVSFFVNGFWLGEFFCFCQKGICDGGLETEEGVGIAVVLKEWGIFPISGF